MLDTNHLNILPYLVESVFMSSSVAVMLIDWNHGFLEIPFLQMLQRCLPLLRKKNIREMIQHSLMVAAVFVLTLNLIKQNIKEQHFAITIEHLRVMVVTVSINVSYWFQKKIRGSKMTDKGVGCTVLLKDKKEGTQYPALEDKEISVSTCCRSSIPRYYFSLSSISTSSSSSCESTETDLDIEEELNESYVIAFRKMFDEEDVSQDEIITAIQYLNTLPGGIVAHRNSEKLMSAVDHVQSMRESSRLDDSGLPMDYSLDELREIMVEGHGYSSEDFDRVVENCFDTSGFLPSPKEFAETYLDMKGIVQLEKEVEDTKKEMEDTKKEMEETMQVVEETQQQVVEARVENERLRQVVHHNHQTIQQNARTIQQNAQTIQQNARTIQQKDQTIQQKERMMERMTAEKDRRIRYLEEKSCEMTEGAWQRKIREMEEQIRRLEIRSTRSECKICKDAEVQVLFNPCGHALSCENCVQIVTVCPICRVQIQGTTKMLLA